MDISSIMMGLCSITLYLIVGYQEGKINGLNKKLEEKQERIEELEKELKKK